MRVRRLKTISCKRFDPCDRYNRGDGSASASGLRAPEVGRTDGANGDARYLVKKMHETPRILNGDQQLASPVYQMRRPTTLLIGQCKNRPLWRQPWYSS